MSDKTPVPPSKRQADRVQCRSSGEMKVEGENHLVQMLDVSSGGCKFRLAGQDDQLPEIQIPIEFEITMGGRSMVGAIVWVMQGMYGCRFYEHISLDDVANVLVGGFRIRLLPTQMDQQTEDA